MEFISRYESLPTSGMVKVPISKRPIQSPKRQRSIGKLPPSKKLKPPLAIQSTKFNSEESKYFTKALLEKDKRIRLLTKEAAELKRDVQELSTSESVEIGNVQRQLNQLRISETSRWRVLKEENISLKIHLAKLLEPEDVRFSDLNSQFCYLPASLKHGDNSPSKRNAHENGINHLKELNEVRDFNITCKNKAEQVNQSENTIIENLEAEIKRLQDILKLYGIDAYAFYPLTVNNTNGDSLGALRSKLGKIEAMTSSEKFRAYEISKSESNIAVTESQNDKEKCNLALQKELFELKSIIEELTSSESALIGELQNKIQRLSSEGKTRIETLEKKPNRLNDHVKEGVARIRELEVENKRINIIHNSDKAGANDSIQNNQIGNILSCQSLSEMKNKMTLGTKELLPTLQESLSRLTLALKSVILSETYPGRHPLGNTESAQNEIDGVNMKLQKKVSLLSKEANQRKLKATLLVEKNRCKNINEREYSTKRQE